MTQRSTKSWSTTKSSIRSGSRTGRTLPGGATRASKGRRRSAWRTSRRSGRTCVHSACGNGRRKPVDSMIRAHETHGELISLVDLLRRRALEEPDRTVFAFLPDGDDGAAATLTRGELDRRARAIAARLQD